MGCDRLILDSDDARSMEDEDDDVERMEQRRVRYDGGDGDEDDEQKHESVASPPSSWRRAERDDPLATRLHGVYAHARSITIAPGVPDDDFSDDTDIEEGMAAQVLIQPFNAEEGLSSPNWVVSFFFVCRDDAHRPWRRRMAPPAACRGPRGRAERLRQLVSSDDSPGTFVHPPQVCLHVPFPLAQSSLLCIQQPLITNIHIALLVR